MRQIDADFITKELGATCIAKRNERGNLIPLGSIDNILTADSRPCPNCEHNDSIYICENCCYNYDSRYEIKRDSE